MTCRYVRLTSQCPCCPLATLPDICAGLQSDDQGLVNTDPRTIAVPDTFINNIPTDVRGLSFSRTPQQLINMYSLGNPDGIGPFFPNGLNGAITKPTGYTNMASGLEDFPSSPYVATQVLVHAHMLRCGSLACRHNNILQSAAWYSATGICCQCHKT